jgi:hypothetical protein
VCRIISIISDNAKTYIQLSGAALALTMTFAHEILHMAESLNGTHPGKCMVDGGCVCRQATV